MGRIGSSSAWITLRFAGATFSWLHFRKLRESKRNSGNLRANATLGTQTQAVALVLEIDQLPVFWCFLPVFARFSLIFVAGSFSREAAIIRSAFQSCYGLFYRRRLSLAFSILHEAFRSDFLRGPSFRARSSTIRRTRVELRH